MKKTTVVLEDDVHLDLKIKLAKEGISFQKKVEIWVSEYLKGVDCIGKK
ncbi:hypothetical protein [Clostridium intestinale]|nr:hypothetical protein [Clostridium intestinale]